MMVMKTETEFERNPLARIFRVVYLGLLMNIAFTLVTFPFFVSMFLYRENTQFLGTLWLTGLTVGPAVQSLLHCYDVLYKEDDVNVFSTFFHYYKKTAGKLFLYGGILLLIQFFYLTNSILFYQSELRFVNSIFTLGSIFTMIMYCNVIYFSVRNPLQPIRAILQVSFFFTIKKWYRGILNCALAVGMLFTMFIWPWVGFVFVPSIFISIFYVNNRQLLQVETHHLKK